MHVEDREARHRRATVAQGGLLDRHAVRVGHEHSIRAYDQGGLLLLEERVDALLEILCCDGCLVHPDGDDIAEVAAVLEVGSEPVVHEVSGGASRRVQLQVERISAAHDQWVGG